MKLSTTKYQFLFVSKAPTLTTRETSPRRAASSAPMKCFPVRIISMARDFPTSRMSLCVPPMPGMVPRLTSGWPNCALGPARMISHSIASSQPPPNAYLYNCQTWPVDQFLDTNGSRKGSMSSPTTWRPTTTSSYGHVLPAPSVITSPLTRLAGCLLQPVAGPLASIT